MPATTPSDAALLNETQRLQARIAVLELERQIPKEIIEKAPVMVSIVRAPDFVYELVNPAFQALAPGKEFLGRRFAEVWAELSEPLVEILQNVIATGETFHLEDAPYTIQRGPGMPPEVVYVSHSWIPLFDPDGKPDRVLTLAYEVTGAVRQRQQLAESKEIFRQSEEQFRVLTQNLQSGVALVDESGAITIVNPSFRSMFDIPQDDDILNINSRNWAQWKVFDERGVLLEFDEHPVRKAALTRTAVRNQLVAMKSPSSPDLKWLLVSAEPILDAQGKLHRLVCTYYDVTERRRAEEDVRRLAQLPEENPNPVLRVSESGMLLYANAPARTWLAATAGGTDQPPTADMQALVQRACREQGQAEAELDGGAGRTFWFSAVQPPGESYVDLYGRDITDRKRAEEALRDSEDRFRTLANAIPQLCWMANADGWIFWYNDRWYEYTGTTPQQMEGWGWQSVHDPEALPAVLERWKASIATGQPFDMVFPLRGADGVFRPFLTRVMPLKDEQGRVLQWFGTNTDISEQKEAEIRLAQSEREFRELAESMPQFVWVTDANGMALFLNHCWQEQLGASVEEMLGEGWARILHPDDRERVLNLWYRCASTGEHYETEYRFRTANGEYRRFLARGVAIRDEQGRIRRWFGTCTDIEDTKRAEERLRQSQKLESVGLLAGGIAHDFNNLLTGVMGNASLLLDDAPSERADTLRSIIASTERAAHLTRQLLAYSGKGQFVVRELDITQAVNEMADLVQFSIPKSADLRLDLQRRLPPVAMDPGQLEQILMNLVINAGEAIGDGNPGRITVSTSMADVQSPFTDELGEEIAPGRYVCIEVRDTGSGIDPEKKAKIFDPFFTTKFVGRGLGLAAIAGILRFQKGGIVVESALGTGSTFRVFLPVAGRTGPAVQEPGLQDGRPVVLVVDDEVAVRDFISAALRRKGYQIVQASDGQEALAVVGSVPGAIGAAIVDIIMPNMSANDLLPALKAKQPGMRILLTSGYSEAEARRLCAAYPGAAFIQKPYTAQQLARAVDELVGASLS